MLLDQDISPTGKVGRRGKRVGFLLCIYRPLATVESRYLLYIKAEWKSYSGQAEFHNEQISKFQRSK